MTAGQNNFHLTYAIIGGYLNMEKNFSIDLQSNESSNSCDIQLPLNFVMVGEIENDDVKVYIRQDLYKKIEHYSSSDTSNELGSILLGKFTESLGKIHVVISEFIEAKYTDASASTLTFTHETWDYIHKEQDRRFPQLKILGWQHTHPSYGIFLSNYDIFIQDNFFNLPFQLAYVVDPIQGIRGFFQWKNGKIEKLKGYYIYDEVGKPIKIEHSKPKQDIRPANSRKYTVLYLCILAILSAGFIITVINLNNRLSMQFQQQTNLEAIVAQQDADIKSLQEAYAGKDAGSDNEDELKNIADRVDMQQTAIDDQKEAMAKIESILEVSDSGNRDIIFTQYTVQVGDNLTKICSEFGINYSASIKIIKALNGIDNVNDISAGQTLILPLPGN